MKFKNNFGVQWHLRYKERFIKFNHIKYIVQVPLYNILIKKESLHKKGPFD